MWLIFFPNNAKKVGFFFACLFDRIFDNRYQNSSEFCVWLDPSSNDHLNSEAPFPKVKFINSEISYAGGALIIFDRILKFLTENELNLKFWILKFLETNSPKEKKKIYCCLRELFYSEEHRSCAISCNSTKKYFQWEKNKSHGNAKVFVLLFSGRYIAFLAIETIFKSCKIYLKFTFSMWFIRYSLSLFKTMTVNCFCTDFSLIVGPICICVRIQAVRLKQNI